MNAVSNLIMGTVSYFGGESSLVNFDRVKGENKHHFWKLLRKSRVPQSLHDMTLFLKTFLSVPLDWYM
uniref:Uncharacterized protein n=1 Tax=Rhizophora mucronata TaxID=61149 RepID=A0A2P2Q6D3_RHIMU